MIWNLIIQILVKNKSVLQKQQYRLFGFSIRFYRELIHDYLQQNKVQRAYS